MVLSMGLMMPLIILVARFFKVTPRQRWPDQLDNPFWFVTHRRWGHVVAVIVIAGLVCALVAEGWLAPWHSVHAILGWAVAALVLVQILSAWMRGTHGGPVDPFTRKRRPPQEWPGDHFSMTPRRIAFEYVHKYAGYVLLALAVAAMPTGLIAADSPRWMPIVTLTIWWLAMLGSLDGCNVRDVASTLSVLSGDLIHLQEIGGVNRLRHLSSEIQDYARNPK